MSPAGVDELGPAPGTGPTATGEPTRPDDGEYDLLATRDAGGAAVRGGALRTAGYAVNAAVSTVAAAFLFRHLGVAATGIYVTALSITTIVGGISDLGLTTLGVRELSVREESQRRQLMSNLLGLRIVVTVGGVTLAVLFAAAAGYRGLLIAGVAVAGVALLAQSLQSTLAIWLMSRLRLGWVTATEVGRQVGVSALTLIFVALGAGVLTFLALQIPAAVVVLCLTALLVRGQVPLVPSFDRGEWAALIRDVLPYSITVALGVIYFRLSVIAVSLTASAQQLGYFATSFRILEVLTAVPGLMVSAALPIFARSATNDHRRLAYAISRVFEVALIVGVWVTLSLALGAGLAIDVVGGAKFAPAAEVLRIQAFALGGGFVGVLWSIVLLSLGRQRQLMLMNLGALVAGSALVGTLALSYGARGAALGTAVTEVALAVVGAAVLMRADAHLLPSLRVVPRVAVAGAAAGALALVPGVSSVALVLAATIVYYGLLALTGAIPEEVLIELRLRRRWRDRRGAA